MIALGQLTTLQAGGTNRIKIKLWKFRLLPRLRMDLFGSELWGACFGWRWGIPLRWQSLDALHYQERFASE